MLIKLMMIYLLLGIITAKVRTNVDHAAETGRRRRGLARCHEPSTVITVKVVVRAGGCKCLFSLKTVINVELIRFFFLVCFVTRERKKRIEKIHRRSHSVSPSPPAFRGRNTAMDAQEALARRQGKTGQHF